jgi:hypothetical protein
MFFEPACRGKMLMPACSNQQFSILTAVDNLSAANRQSSTNTEQKLNEIKDELLKQAEKGDGIDYTLLRTLARAGKGVAKRRNILGSLLFPSYQTRYESIQQAHRETFDWVFNNPTNNLGEWLKTGGGIYWVQGKAGSGKSTLMRYLSGHPDTSAALKSWAGTERQLVICRHFFWNAGSAMQKSQAGLLQTLLYQVFKECLDLIESVCPARWSNEDSGYIEPWTRDDLFAAFGELSKLTLASVRFCFFVDGLDEYHGDHRDLIALLNKLSESPAFKLCASSRPWNAFVHAFQECPQLKLEDLTANDIAAYVRDLFKQNNEFERLQSEDSKCNEIVKEIVRKAKGVFLWVSLVVADLLKGIAEGDNISDMQRRLDFLPDDLEKLFQVIIQNIDSFYREEGIRYFEIAIHALEPLPVLAFYFLDEENRANHKDYAMHALIRPYLPEQIEEISSKMKKRLNARCKDLLEVVENKSWWVKPPMNYHKVDFLHRTVRDFFLSTDAMKKLRDGLAVSYFDAKLSLCSIVIALSKTLPVETDSVSKHVLLHKAMLYDAARKARPLFYTMFNLTDELIFHAKSIEIDDSVEDHEGRLMMVAKLLDELDRVNLQHTATLGFAVHWAGFRAMPMLTFGDYYFVEDGTITFLSVAIQTKLVFYVKEKLDEDPNLIKRKLGRPLLDYALRPNMVSFKLPSYDSRPDLKMVLLLLEHGADPNSPVQRYNDMSVWHLFLRHCDYYFKHHRYDRWSKDDASDIYSVVELLVQHGADFEGEFSGVGGHVLTAASALSGLLTKTDIETLQRLSKNKSQGALGSIRSWLIGWG